MWSLPDPLLSLPDQEPATVPSTKMEWLAKPTGSISTVASSTSRIAPAGSSNSIHCGAHSVAGDHNDDSKKADKCKN